MKYGNHRSVVFWFLQQTYVFCQKSETAKICLLSQDVALIKLMETTKLMKQLVCRHQT